MTETVITHWQTTFSLCEIIEVDNITFNFIDMVNSSSESRSGSNSAKFAPNPFIFVDPCPFPAHNYFIMGVVMGVVMCILTRRFV